MRLLPHSYFYRQMTGENLSGAGGTTLICLYDSFCQLGYFCSNKRLRVFYARRIWAISLVPLSTYIERDMKRP